MRGCREKCENGRERKYNGVQDALRPALHAGALDRPGRCGSTGGPAMAGSAEPSPPLPARRLLARGDLHPADVGAARHGGHASPSRVSRRRLLRPRWVLLSPAPAAGVPDPKVEFGRWLVTAPAPGHGPGRRNQRTFAKNVLLIDLCGPFRGRRGRALHLKLCILFARAMSETTKRYSCPVPRAPKATIRLRSNAKIQQPFCIFSQGTLYTKQRDVI